MSKFLEFFGKNGSVYIRMEDIKSAECCCKDGKVVVHIKEHNQSTWELSPQTIKVLDEDELGCSINNTAEAYRRVQSLKGECEQKGIGTKGNIFAGIKIKGINS